MDAYYYVIDPWEAGNILTQVYNCTKRLGSLPRKISHDLLKQIVTIFT